MEKLDDQQKRQIIDLYLNADLPSSFGPIKQFHQFLKSDLGIEVPIVELRTLLKEYIPSLTLDKETQHNFDRRVLLCNSIDESWSLDLAFFPSDILRSNRIGGLLICVDNLSHYCWIRPVKSTKSIDVARVFQEILEQSGRKPVNIITDAGNEFVGESFQKRLSENGIKHQISSQQPNKASIAELHIKLFKGYVKRWMRQHKSKQFVSHLQQFVDSLNNRSLERLQGLSPIELNADNQHVAIEYLQTKSKKLKPNSRGIEVGDLVRIQLPKAFGATAPRYSQELFIVDKKLDARNPVLFKLTDLAGDPLKRVWYARQLAVVKKNHA